MKSCVALVGIYSVAFTLLGCYDKEHFILEQNTASESEYFNDTDNETHTDDETDVDTETRAEAGSDPNPDSETGSAQNVSVSECKSASDCQLVNDCCNCMAIRTDQSPPDCPPTPCKAPACSPHSLSPAEVDCVAGRCVLNLSCDDSSVTCKMARPECPEGQEPVVNETVNCWTGHCIEVTQCSAVPSCEVCGSNEPCVTYEEKPNLSYHCVTNTAECQDDPTCDCLHQSVCTSPYYACLDSPSGMACSNPAN